VVFCGFCFTIFVPNQPDVFFGDFAEPLPNGYVLTGLGKMPEYAYFESTPPHHQPPLLGGVKRLEQDGQVIFGAYGPLNHEAPPLVDSKAVHGYFAFDTRTGEVRNFTTLDELTGYAGHRLNLVESEYFRSQIPGRRRLREIESLIYSGPPALSALLCLYMAIRYRFSPMRQIASNPN